MLLQSSLVLHSSFLRSPVKDRSHSKMSNASVITHNYNTIFTNAYSNRAALCRGGTRRSPPFTIRCSSSNSDSNSNSNSSSGRGFNKRHLQQILKWTDHPKVFPLILSLKKGFKQSKALDQKKSEEKNIYGTIDYDAPIASEPNKIGLGTKMGNEGFGYTLDEALSTIGFGKFQLIVLAYAGLGWIAEAMEMMLLSFVGPAIQPEWGLSSNQESLISTLAFAGMLIGAYSWGVISDSYGRKKGFLGSAIITSVAGFLSAFAPNYVSLLILRFIVGVGLGCGHVFTSWFLEFVPTPNRGAWMIVFSTFWTIGTIMEASLAWWIMPNYGWRWLLILSAVPSLLALLFYSFVPESPRYLCTQGRLTDARHILENGAKLNQKELPEGLLVSDHINEMTSNCESSESTMLLSSIRNKTNNYQKSSTSIYMVLSPKLMRTTLLLWFLYFANTFSYYGIILLTSQLSMGQSECDPLTLQSENIKDSSLYVNVFITSLAELPGLGLAAFILDRLGRKISMEIMLVAGFILLLPLVVHQNAIMTTGFLFGARMFISASFIVVCIYAPEVYPTNLRTTGVGIATAIGRIGGMVCPLIAVGMGSGCHQTLPVILFEVTILLSGLSVMLLPFETKGKDLSDDIDLRVERVQVE